MAGVESREGGHGEGEGRGAVGGGPVNRVAAPELAVFRYIQMGRDGGCGIADTKRSTAAVRVGSGIGGSV